jgi:archaellum component FlaC|tara:strand:- start:88 stop:411 length:324 start_codon:yes stop_codon:yes gene_type:complete
MANPTSYQTQVKQELKNMDHRLDEMEEKMTSIDAKLTQVVDAILGNSLTKSGGFVNDIDKLKEKIELLEAQVKKQEEFKKKFTWTVGLVTGGALIIQYFINLYTKLK